jgi:hypothetical protein
MKKINELSIAKFARVFFTCFISVFLCVSILNAQPYKNCSEIHFFNSSASSGVYLIDPDGNGPMLPMNCQCDMTTDGGGWTLVLNYNHLENSSPDLKVYTDGLPIQGQTVLGFDESNTVYWGHAGTEVMSTLAFDEVRFYGVTSDHSRVIDFKTSHIGTVSYFKTGSGSTEGIKDNYTAFAGHSSFLPASIDHTVSDMGDYAMTAYPLWTGSAYHWFLGGVDPNCTVRWEVDNYPCNYTPSTFHQMWVRQNAFLGIRTGQKSGIDTKLTPNPFNNKAELTIANLNPQQLSMIRINVYDLLGKQFYPVITRNSVSFTIEKGSLAPGIYICKLMNAAGIITVTKMIIE